MSKPIEFDKLAIILKAATMAPTAGNIQDYRFIVITEKEKISEIANHCIEQYWISQAPVLIVVCADSDRTETYYGLRGAKLYSIQNSAAAVMNIMLAANDLDLGSCWIGSFDEEYLSDNLNIPENIRPQAIVTLGYPGETPKPREQQAMDSLIFFNNYGQSIENINTHMNEYNKEIEKILKKADPKIDNAFKKLGQKTKAFYHKTKENIKKANNNIKVKK